MKGKCLTSKRVNCLSLIVNQKPFMPCCLSRIHVSVNGLMKLIHLSTRMECEQKKEIERRGKEGKRKESSEKGRERKEIYSYRKIINSY